MQAKTQKSNASFASTSLLEPEVDGQNISISEVDTYISRQSQRGIKVLQTKGSEGLSVDQLLSQRKTTGTDEKKSQCVLDLGYLTSMNNNFKWRSER